MSEYQLSVLAEGSIVPLLPLVVSFVFWIRTGRGPIWPRLAGCSHGARFFAAYVYAVLVCPYSNGYGYGERNPYDIPFVVLLGVGLASTLASLALFRGRRALLLLHLVSLPAAAGAAFVGGMAISHDWL